MKRLLTVFAAAVAVLTASAKVTDTQDFETANFDIYDFFRQSVADEDSSAQAAGSSIAVPLGGDANGSYYIALDTGDATLWRTNEFAASYFDMALKFTPTAAGDEPTPGAEDKILVYMDAETNIVVISGTAANDTTPVTNTVKTAGIQANAWARLSISAKDDRFFVYVNGTSLNDTTGYYSLASGTTIKEVGFSGSGALDNFVARTTDPFLTAENAVASIGGENYSTLAQAVAEASAGDTILLRDDVEDSSVSVVLPFANVSLDTNGKTFNGSVSAASGLGWTLNNGVYTADNNTASTWVGAAAGADWTVTNNWSNHAVPTASTAVTIPAAANGCTIYVGGNAQAASIKLLGNATIQRDAGVTAAGNLVVHGNITTGSTASTLTLNTANVYAPASATVTIGCNVKTVSGKFNNVHSGFRTLTGNSANFILNGDIEIQGVFYPVANITFNGTTRLNAGIFARAYARDGSSSNPGGTPVFNGAVDLVGDSSVRTYAVTYNAAVTIDSTSFIYIQSASQAYGSDFSLSGSGRVVFDTNDTKDAMKAQLRKTDGTWTGTCELRNWVWSTNFNHANYANPYSTLCFNGATCGTLGTHNTSYGMKVELLGDGLTLNGALSENILVAFTNSLFGAGTLTLANTGNNTSTLRFSGDVSGFTGNVSVSGKSRLAFGSDQEGDAPRIYVHTGKSVTVADGATWTTTGGVFVRGDLEIAGTATVTSGTAPSFYSGSHVTIAENATLTIPTGGAVTEGDLDVSGHIVDTASNVGKIFCNSTSGTAIARNSTAFQVGNLDSWSGTYVIAWNGGDSTEAFYINNYGKLAGATIRIDGVDGAFSGYPLVSGGTAPNVTAKVVLNANWTIGDGVANQTNTFASLSGSGNVTVTSETEGISYKFNSLDGYTGTLGGDAEYVIGDIVYANPAFGDCLVKASAQPVLDDATVNGAETNVCYDTVGGLSGVYLTAAKVVASDSSETPYGSIGNALAAADSSSAVTVGVYDTANATNDKPGWYYSNGVYTSVTRAVAFVGDVPYASLAEAIAAAVEASASVVRLAAATSESVTIPGGITVAVDDDVAFDGTIAGAGAIQYTKAPAAIPAFGEGWTGSYVANYEMYDSQTSANSKTFPYTITPNKYGRQGSTVVIGANLVSDGTFFAKNNEVSAPNISPAVYLKADVTISEGFAGTGSGQKTIFAELGADSGKTLTTREASSDRPTYYDITKVKNFAGTLVIRKYSKVKIVEIVCGSTPAVGTRVMAVTCDATGAQLLDLAKTVVTVDGADQGVKLEYLASGAEGSGVYVKSVARIEGGQGYATLAAAVADAADGDTVTLLDNVTLDARVEPNVGVGTSLAFNLGGYTITRTGTSGNGSVFDVKSGNVVVTNGVIDCTQDDTAIVADGVYALTVRSGATLTLDDLTVRVNSECGACVYPFDGATVSILDGTYENLTATPYRWKEGWTGMAINQANVAQQLVTIYGGSFKQVDPALGDDKWADGAGTFLAEGKATTFENGYYVVGVAQYTVNFIVDDVTNKTEVAYGAKATAPAAPTKAGYVFRGWSPDTNAVITAATDFTAQWGLVGYTVTYTLKTAVGTAPANAEYTVETASPYELAQPGAVEGYTFSGWYDNSELTGDPVTSFDIDTSDPSAKAFYGEFRANAPVTPTVDPADPSKPAEVQAESANAAIEVVAIAAPSGVDAADYKALFDFSATEKSGVPGTYEVTVTGIKASVEQAITGDAAAIVSGSAASGTVTIPAGLYYEITTMTSLDGATTVVGRDISTGAGVTVAKPGTTQGFIKVKIGTASFGATVVPSSGE